MSRDYLRESDSVRIIIYSEEGIPEKQKKAALEHHRYGAEGDLVYVARPEVDFCDTSHEGHRVASPALEKEIMGILSSATGNSYAVVHAALNAKSSAEYLALGRQGAVRLVKVEG